MPFLYSQSHNKSQSGLLSLSHSSKMESFLLQLHGILWVRLRGKSDFRHFVEMKLLHMGFALSLWADIYLKLLWA